MIVADAGPPRPRSRGPGDCPAGQLVPVHLRPLFPPTGHPEALPAQTLLPGPSWARAWLPPSNFLTCARRLVPSRPGLGRGSGPVRPAGTGAGGGREERHLCPAKGHPGGRATRWAQLLQGGGAGPGREAQSGPRRLHKGDSWGGGLPEGHRCREWGLCLGAGACSRQWGSWEGDRTQGWALEDAGQGLGGCPESGCGWPERAPPLAPAEVSAWWEGAGPWGWKREAEQDPSPNTRHQQQSQGNLRREAPQRLPLTSPPAGPRPQAGRGGGGALLRPAGSHF